ncbi:MAG: DUF2318 domain-containing protein [Spirochaetaceae bacterium]|jgi:uncharacterized membrane protein|nr:DUF2318 domain-containing protein [Spirochaetaceae bacterium]
MIRYFIAAVEYALTASMLTGLCYGAARRIDIEIEIEVRGGGARRSLTFGILAGTLFALTLAILRRTTAINRGMVATAVLCLSIIAALCFIPLLWRGPSRCRFPLLWNRLFQWAGAVFAGSIAASAMPSLFLLPSEFMLAGQSVFSTEFLLKSGGALAGVALPALIGLGLFHAARRGRDFVFRLVFTLMAACNAVHQAALAAQFLMARRILPLTRWLFRFVMNAVNREAVFRYAGIALALILALALLADALLETARQREPARNPAEGRKIRARRRRDVRRGVSAAAALALALASLTALKAWDTREIPLSPAEPMDVSGGEISIPLERIADGRLHRFAWDARGVEVRFIVIKKSAAAYGVGLDACDICGSTGYYERRDEVICRLCDVVMNKSTIGFKGGCNPVPLAYTVRRGAMIVLIADLEREKSRFQ